MNQSISLPVERQVHSHPGLGEHADSGAPTDTVCLAVRLRGPLNVSGLQRAMGEVLRQRVRLALEDLSVLAEAERADAYQQLANEAAQRPLKSSETPHIVLVQMGENEHVLLLAMQRAAFREGLVRKVADVYGGRGPAEEPAGPDGQKQLASWSEKLKGAATLDLPTDRPRSAVKTVRAGIHKFEIHALSAETIAAGFLALLHRYTGQEDVVIAARIGKFVPLRCDLSGEPSFTELLRRATESLREALKHANAPDQPSDLSVLFEYTEKGEYEAGGVRFSVERVDNGTCIYELALTVESTSAALQFNCDLFTESTAQRMAGHLQTLLQAASANPGQPVSRLPLLTDMERRMIVEDWNETRTEYPGGKCIHELFVEQATRTPDATAITFENRSLSYRELDVWSNQVAARLQKEGVGPEIRVGVCMNRSLKMMVALLAIHKAGGAYVPMDPTYPQERLAFMIEDAQTPILITDKTLAERFPTAKAVFIDAFDANGAVDVVDSKVTPENLAYLIYTSGSTGKPKGVMVCHRNVVNFFTGMDAAIGSEAGVWLAVTSISFDISVLELFWTLTRGFKVVIQAEERNASVGYSLSEQIKRHNVTHFQCTPSLVAMMLENPKTAEALRTVKKLFFGGEPMPPTLVERLQGAGEIFNMYGPTETTIWSTVQPVTRSGGKITIGYPIANTQVYILDKHLQPCPIGIPGELYIGGDGVVRGYLNRPELTAERFIANPFKNDPVERIYRTGDLARFREGGEIEFLGRIDHQVKLRGFRIELGEIEAAVRQHEAVKECVVSVWEAGPNDKRLVAYLVAQPGAKPQAVDLRRFVKQKLPEYMVPSLFIILDVMPLTPNGKIDRKALPKPEARNIADNREIAASVRPSPLEAPVLPGTRRMQTAQPEIARTLPLTDGQKEIWFASQMSDAASCAFNESCVLQLKGELDEHALARAIQHVIARHEALRTTFSASGEEQYVHAEMPVLLRTQDLPASEEFRQALDESCAEEVRAAFDLVKGPLARFRLLRKTADYHVLIVTAHHLVCDGGSLGMVVRELGESYSAACKNEALTLPTPQQFHVFAEQQKKNKASAAYQRAEQFWLKQFAEQPAVLDLPSDHPRPVTRSYRGAAAWRRLEMAAELRKFSAQQRCTLFTTLLGGFYVLLHRLSGQSEILVGVPAAAREGEGSDRLVGHCVNFLPLRLHVSGEAPFTEHLLRVRNLVMDGYDHQNYTLGNLLQKLNLGRDASRPLVSVMFNLELRKKPVMAGLEVVPTPNSKLMSNFDLSFNLIDDGAEIEVSCTYSLDLFEPETIDRWLGHFQTLLRSIVASPTTVVSDLALLSDAEKKLLLEGWNRTEIPLPTGTLLHQLFETQAAKQPDAPALRHATQTLTYSELNRRANQMANYLRDQGIRPGALVGVCMPRSPELLPALLGIMKAGGAYVPLDPEYPKERLRGMIEAANAELVITTVALRTELFAEARTVLIDREWPQIQQGSDAAPTVTIGEADLAYVMFTSGSTGGPKAVGLEHRNAVAFLYWAKHQFTADELSGVFASTSICFDLSVFELFAPISWGGTVVLADNPMQLSTHSARDTVRLVNTVPSAVPELLKAGLPPSVTTFNLAGEALTQKLVDDLYSVRTIQRVYDLYGPTENTTYSTGGLRVKGGRPTIGRPLANTEAYIVDARLQPVPIGVPGELLVGGAFLTRGYLGQPELTRQKFIPHPFKKEPGARIYRTGDLTRYLPNGDIEFLGRIDHQIKLRGYRIEPGDIEAELETHPAVGEAAVILREDTPGQKRIAAYVECRPGKEASSNELRDFLRERLPAYMIPAAFVQLEKLPLTPNGKLDRRALPAPEQVTGQNQAPTEEAALSDVEQVLAEIWREVIGIETIGRNDNFFDLGGHSILITQIIARCRNTLGVELTLRNFFEAPTIGELAPIVEQQLLEQVDALPEAAATEVLSKD